MKKFNIPIIKDSSIEIKAKDSKSGLDSLNIRSTSQVVNADIAVKSIELPTYMDSNMDVSVCVKEYPDGLDNLKDNPNQITKATSMEVTVEPTKNLSSNIVTPENLIDRLNINTVGTNSFRNGGVKVSSSGASVNLVFNDQQTINCKSVRKPSEFLDSLMDNVVKNFK